MEHFLTTSSLWITSISVTVIAGVILLVIEHKTGLFIKKPAIDNEQKRPAKKPEIPVVTATLPSTAVIQKDAKTDDIDVLIASLKNIRDGFYASNSVKSGIKNLSGRITGNELADILVAANIKDDFYLSQTVTYCARFLRRPVTGNDTSRILDPIGNAFYKSQAADALMAAIKKAT